MIPKYLEAASVCDHVIRYEWDDWKTLPALEAVDEVIIGRLKRVSFRAVLAFACASAEWIVYRFRFLSDDSAPWQYLDVAWAMIVSVRYHGRGKAVTWQEYSYRKWGGPIRGPIGNALKYLEMSFEQLVSDQRTDPTIYAATILTLARYVMTNPQSYNAWVGKVLDRFESLYPRNSKEPKGDAVPHEAVDPDFDFRPANTELLINQFLKGLDYNSNIFLSSPSGMLEQYEDEENFDGEPYVFDIARDRNTRAKSSKHEK